LEALAETLFSALRRDDYDRVATCFSAEATWWIAGSLRGPASDFLAARRLQKHPIGPRTYEEVRRMFSDEGFVEQHVTKWTGPGGQTRRFSICAVVRVNGEGLVTTFEEYYDPAALSER
jgi:ketosteroid isomerase-like protein